MSSNSQPRVTMSVNETADLLGISRWLAYEQIQRGELPVIRMGRRLRVPVRPVLALVGMSWEDWLAAQPRLLEAAAGGDVERVAEGLDDPLLDVGRQGGIAGVAHARAVPYEACSPDVWVVHVSRGKMVR